MSGLGGSGLDSCLCAYEAHTTQVLSEAYERHALEKNLKKEKT
jgi:hypothetical protein